MFLRSTLLCRELGGAPGCPQAWLQGAALACSPRKKSKCGQTKSLDLARKKLGVTWQPDPSHVLWLAALGNGFRSWHSLSTAHKRRSPTAITTFCYKKPTANAKGQGRVPLIQAGMVMDGLSLDMAQIPEGFCPGRLQGMVARLTLGHTETWRSIEGPGQSWGIPRVFHGELSRGPPQGLPSGATWQSNAYMTSEVPPESLHKAHKLFKWVIRKKINYWFIFKFV